MTTSQESVTSTDSLDSPEEFLAAWLEGLRRAGFQGQLEPGEGVRLVRIENGHRTVTFDGTNSYERYLDFPEEREEQLSVLIQGFRSHDETSPYRPDLSRVLPVIRPVGFAEKLGLSGAPFYRLTEELLVHLVEDQSHLLRYLRAQDVEATGQSFADLLKQATQNIKALGPFQENDLGDGYMLLAGGDYESSIILDRPLITEYTQRLGGDVICSIPVKDLFIISRIHDAGLRTHARVMANFLDRPEGILSRKIYTYRQDKLVAVARVDLDEQGEIHVTGISEDTS